MTRRNAPATGTQTARKRRPNTARSTFRSVTRNREPVKFENLSDLAVLRFFFTERQAVSILERCGPGGLKAWATLDGNGPRSLLELPGIDEGGAAKIYAAYELAVRIL